MLFKLLRNEANTTNSLTTRDIIVSIVKYLCYTLLLNNCIFKSFNF